MTERLTIGETAERLGVSPDTVRRRLKRGELQGEQEQTAQGFIWRIVLPEAPDEPQDCAVGHDFEPVARRARMRVPAKSRHPAWRPD